MGMVAEHFQIPPGGLPELPARVKGLAEPIGRVAGLRMARRPIDEGLKPLSGAFDRSPPLLRRVAEWTLPYLSGSANSAAGAPRAEEALARASVTPVALEMKSVRMVVAAIMFGAVKSLSV